MRKGEARPRSPASQGVNRTLQDESGRAAVDLVRTFRPAHVRSDHVALDSLRGPAFVAQQNGEPKVGYVAGKGTARLATRAFAAVHVEGKANDDATGWDGLLWLR